MTISKGEDNQNGVFKKQKGCKNQEGSKNKKEKNQTSVSDGLPKMPFSYSSPKTFELWQMRTRRGATPRHGLLLARFTKVFFDVFENVKRKLGQRLPEASTCNAEFVQVTPRFSTSCLGDINTVPLCWIRYKACVCGRPLSFALRLTHVQLLAP